MHVSGVTKTAAATMPDPKGGPQQRTPLEKSCLREAVARTVAETQRLVHHVVRSVRVPPVIPAERLTW